MKNLLTLWIGILLLLMGFNAASQTDLLFSNSLNTAFIYNPALIEANEMINLRLSGRQQWVGFPDAPRAAQFSGAYFFDVKKMGVKLQLTAYGSGKETVERLVAAYAYRVKLTEVAYLNLGLGAGIYQRSILYSRLIYNEGNEPLIRPDERYIQPDFEFGVHFGAGRTEAGIAINHLGQINRNLSVKQIPLHAHLYAAYLFNLSSEYRLRAGASFHQQGKVSYIQLDAHALLGNLQAGVGLRNNDAFLFKAGIIASENLEFHYSFDLGIAKMSSYNSGTHEFLILVRLQKPEKTYLSPRYLDY